MSAPDPDDAGPAISVYGADWCSDTRSARSFLDARGVPYRYVDVDQDPRAAEWIRRQNGGKQVTPTIDIQGLILVNPSHHELADVLRSAGVAS